MTMADKYIDMLSFWYLICYWYSRNDIWKKDWFD